MAAASWSEIRGDSECEAVFALNQQYLFGTTVGAVCDFDLGRRLAPGVEILVTHRGAELKGNDMRLTYLQVPVTLWAWGRRRGGTDDGVRVGLGGGLAPAYNTSFHMNDGPISGANSWDLCLLLGVALEAGRLKLELRYDAGLLDVDPGSSDFWNRSMSVAAVLYL